MKKKKKKGQSRALKVLKKKKKRGYRTRSWVQGRVQEKPETQVKWDLFAAHRKKTKWGPGEKKDRGGGGRGGGANSCGGMGGKTLNSSTRRCLEPEAKKNAMKKGGGGNWGEYPEFWKSSYAPPTLTLSKRKKRSSFNIKYDKSHAQPK